MANTSFLVIPSRWTNRTPSAPSAANLEVGLVSHWKLEEASGDRLDSHGIHDLSHLGGNPSRMNNEVKAGKIGDAPNLWGSDSYLEVDHDDFDLETFSVALWYHPDYMETAQSNIFSRGSSDWASGSWALRQEFNKLQFRAYTDVQPDTLDFINGVAGSGAITVADTLYNVNWYHLVGVIDLPSNTIKVAINGGDWITNTFPAGSTVLKPGAGGIYLGTTKVSGTPTSPYQVDGSIDEVSFWNREVTTGEKNQLYNSGVGLQYPFTGVSAIANHHWSLDELTSSVRLDSVGSKNLIDGSSTDVLNNADSKFGTNSISGFGNYSWLEVAENQEIFVTGVSWSIVAWVKRGATNPAIGQTILSKGDANVSSTTRSFSLSITDLGWTQFRIFDSIPTTVTVSDSTNLIEANSAWSLIVVTQDIENSLIKVSVNGNNYITKAYTITPNLTDKPFVVGGLRNSTGTLSGTPFDGKIDNVTVFDKLSQEDVTSLWSSGAGLDFPFNS